MRKKIYIGLGAVFLIFAGLYSYLKQKVDEQEHLNTGLRPNEVRKLVKKGNDITLTYRDKEGREQKKSFKGNRNLSVTEDNQGKIVVYAPTKGWTFEPGLAVGVSDHLRYGLDLQFFYWNNFGLEGFVLGDNDMSFRLGVAGNYSVYSNTSLFLGIDHQKDVTFGVRVRL